jgi:PAS domain-containing protein
MLQPRSATTGQVREGDMDTKDAAVTGIGRGTHDHARAAWRAAERVLSTTPRESPAYHDALVAVVEAWLRYEERRPGSPNELILIADDDRTFLAVSNSVEATLGYAPAELLGKRVDDIVHLPPRQTFDGRWDEFRTAGREVSVVALAGRDGAILFAEYDAIADSPAVGCHTSRLRVIAQRR